MSTSYNSKTTHTIDHDAPQWQHPETLGEIPSTAFVGFEDPELFGGYDQNTLFPQAGNENWGQFSDPHRQAQNASFPAGYSDPRAQWSEPGFTFPNDGVATTHVTGPWASTSQAARTGMPFANYDPYSVGDLDIPFRFQQPTPTLAPAYAGPFVQGGSFQGTAAPISSYSQAQRPTRQVYPVIPSRQIPQNFQQSIPYAQPYRGGPAIVGRNPAYFAIPQTRTQAPTAPAQPTTLQSLLEQTETEQPASRIDEQAAIRNAAETETTTHPRIIAGPSRAKIQPVPSTSHLPAPTATAAPSRKRGRDEAEADHEDPVDNYSDYSDGEEREISRPRKKKKKDCGVLTDVEWTFVRDEKRNPFPKFEVKKYGGVDYNDPSQSGYVPVHIGPARLTSKGAFACCMRPACVKKRSHTPLSIPRSLLRHMAQDEIGDCQYLHEFKRKDKDGNPSPLPFDKLESVKDMDTYRKAYDAAPQCLHPDCICQRKDCALAGIRHGRLYTSDNSVRRHIRNRHLNAAERKAHGIPEDKKRPPRERQPPTQKASEPAATENNKKQGRVLRSSGGSGEGLS